MNKADKNPTLEHENENRDLKKTHNSQFSTLNPDDDKVVFVPAEEIRLIESIYDKMEQAKQEFCRVVEGMKRIEN